MSKINVNDTYFFNIVIVIPIAIVVVTVIETVKVLNK